MQSLLQEAGVMQSKPIKEKFRSQPIIKSRDSTPIKQGMSQEKFRSRKPTKRPTVPAVPVSKPRLEKRKDKEKFVVEPDEKFTHRSVQTERTDDLNKLYETGVIKYPSPSILKSKVTPREASPVKSRCGQGDSSLETDLQNLGKYCNAINLN